MAATYEALLSKLDRRAWAQRAVSVTLPWWRKLPLAAKLAF
jgi:hypothetical protein